MCPRLGAYRRYGCAGLAGAIGAKAWARADAWMIATGIGALGVDGAAAALGIQVQAIAIGPAGEGVDAVLEVEMLHDPGLHQALGDLLGRLALGFKGIYHPYAHQISQLDLDWHGATGGHAAIAHAIAVFQPGAGTVQIGMVQQYGLGGHAVRQ